MGTLTIPPYRAALLTGADGTPMVRASGPDSELVMTERQWYMFWQNLAAQLNANTHDIEGLGDLVTYGNHADRPDPGPWPDGALYVEQDRGSVLYQNQGGTWVYIAGIMYGTLAPDQRPADLGPAADAGFQFRTTTDPARAFAWNGGQWVETTPTRYGTHAERLAETIADLVSGMLWMETDRGDVSYQNQGGVWQYITGTMYGTLSPDQRPTDLTAAQDAGFQFRTNVDPARAFAWSGGSWIETTPVRFGTHAERLAATIANLVSGMLWFETDRDNVVYQVQTVAGSPSWIYVGGIMTDAFAALPAGLGANDVNFTFATSDTYEVYRWSGSTWVNQTPGNLTYFVSSSVGLVLTSSIQDVPGATLTVNRPGRYMAIGTASFSQTSAFAGIIGACLFNVAGSLLSASMVFRSINTGAGATVCQTGNFTLASTPQTVKLQAYQNNAATCLTLDATNTTLLLVWIGP